MEGCNMVDPPEPILCSGLGDHRVHRSLPELDKKLVGGRSYLLLDKHTGNLRILQVVIERFYYTGWDCDIMSIVAVLY